MIAVDNRPLGLTEVRQAWQELLDPSRPPVDAADAPRVVVILASSRGGSSWFHQLLRGTGRFVSLEGEHTSLYRLNGMLAETGREAHDGQLHHDDERRQAFARALGSQLTVPRQREADEKAAVRRFCRLLWLQWGAMLPEPDRLRAIVTGCVHAGRPGEHETSLLLRVLRVLRETGHSVQPWYYDLPPAVVRAAFPRLEQPAGPPPRGVVAEEPPFVVPTLARTADRDDLSRYPLLLKASVDAYRIADLPKLFPAARITHVHLVRNPAASINGLMDGWLHRGFFSRLVPGNLQLDIAGYSHLPWGRNWWNFDLPPGWAGTRGQPLSAVCGHQWASAHEAILAARPLRTMRLAVEDILCDSHAAVAAVLAAVGERDWRPNAPARAPVVMSTVSPAPARWRFRRAVLADVLATCRIREMAQALGYGSEPHDGWR